LWEIDANLDFIYEKWGVFGVTCSGGPSSNTPENCEKFKTCMEAVVTKYNDRFRQLPSNKFICGPRLTLPDFMMASLVFTHWMNDGHVFGPTVTDMAKECMNRPENKHFMAYITRLKAEFEPILSARKPSPM